MVVGLALIVALVLIVDLFDLGYLLFFCFDTAGGGHTLSVLISVRFCFVSDFSAIVGTAVSCSAAPFFLLALLFSFLFFCSGG